MDFSKLNTLGNVELLPLKKLVDLEGGKTYHISRLRSVHTKYGMKIIVDTYDDFSFFLTGAMSEYLLEQNEKEKLQELIKCCEEKRLYVKCVEGETRRIVFEIVPM